MISTEALAQQSPLSTKRLELVQLGLSHFEGVWTSLSDEETNRLTGTHRKFTREQIREYLATREGCDDRADWAILRRSDMVFLGEVVLNDLDYANESMNFRIALSDKGVLGQGYGTEATRAVVQYGFDEVKLHRISLGVYAFNPRARRTYEKCGFVLEGVERHALLWEGQWVDQFKMALLLTDPRAPLPTH